MILKALSNIGDNNPCYFNDQSGAKLFYTKTTLLENEMAMVGIYDSNDKEIAKITYRNSKIKTRKFVIEEADGSKIEIHLDDKNNLVNDDLKLCLHRSHFDKKLTCSLNDKEIMKCKCKTLIRQWLRGEYEIEVLDENRLNLIVYMLVISFVAIYNEHTCTQPSIL